MSWNLSALVGLALGTLLSEDLASIGAGLLAREGQIALVPAIVACTAGVYLGDLGLWLTGRVLGRRLVTLPWFTRQLDISTTVELASRLDTRLGLAVLGSRFLPGSRLPIYVVAGIWGRRPVAFAAWSLVAVLLWTPLLVLLTARFGSALTAPIVGDLGVVFHFVVTAVTVLMVTKLAGQALARRVL